MIHNVYAICNNLLDLPPAYSELQKKIALNLANFYLIRFIQTKVSIHAP